MNWTTISVEMDREQIAALYRFCAEQLITVDELADRLMGWLLDNPEETKAWVKEHMKPEEENEKISEHA